MMVDTQSVRIDLGPCIVCGRPAFTVYSGGAIVLKDQVPLCGSCVRRIRFLYPVSQYMQRGMWVTEDPLKDLDTEAVLQAVRDAPERLEDLREEYGCDAVFRIEDVRKESGGLFKAPLLRLRGYPLFGRFNMGEDVSLVHEGTVYPVHLDDVSGGALLTRTGEAGYECVLKCSAKGIQASPGDLVTKQ